MKTFTFSHLEIALILGALARSKNELELLSDQFMNDFKRDLEALMNKLEDISGD